MREEIGDRVLFRSDSRDLFCLCSHWCLLSSFIDTIFVQIYDMQKDIELLPSKYRAHLDSVVCS